MEALIYSETTFYRGRLNIFEKGIFVAWFESLLRLSSVLVLFCFQGTVTSAKVQFFQD